uniref:Uncharacterized protein n=1 Tax=Parascaris univalens TaxID=6257 RepID=A0A915CBE9_PARUN
QKKSTSQVEKKHKMSERKETDMSTDDQDRSDCCYASAYQVLELKPCSSRAKTSSVQVSANDVSSSTVRIVVPVSEVTNARIPDRLVPGLSDAWKRDVPNVRAAAEQTLDACSTSAQFNSFVTETEFDTSKEEACSELQTTAGMNRFDELRAFNAMKLTEKISMRDEEFIDWLTKFEANTSWTYM